MRNLQRTRAAWEAVIISLASLGAASHAAEPGKSRPAVKAQAAASAAPSGRTPLRFDPPGAGPTPASTAYEACIDHPSPDGLVMDCQALREPTPAKARRKR